jgi:O-antigen/teichoic acid export membrane protein
VELRLVLKNTAALGIATILSRAVSAIVGIFVTRYLGPTPFGEYSSAYAFVTTFILFTDLGLGQLMVQEGARDEKALPSFLGTSLLFKFFTCSVAYGLMLILMYPAGYNFSIRIMVMILGVASGLNALDATFYNYFQAKQKMYLAASYQFLSTFIIGLLTILVLVYSGNVILITVTHLATAILITLLLFNSIKREIKLSFEWNRIWWMVQKGLPFGVAYIFYNVYFQIDSVMLSVMRTPGEVGIYSAAYRLISITLFIPGVITSVFYPILFQLGVTSKEKHQQTIEKIFKVLSAVGIPGSMLLFVLAEPLLGWLYAHRFGESVPILMLLSWFFALECLGFSLGDVLTTTNRQWSRTWIQGIAALGNIVLNLFLIPNYGIYGASVATLITEIFVFAAYYWQVRKHVYHIQVWSQLTVIVCATLIMGIVSYLIRSFHPLVSISLSGLIYLIILIGFDSDFRRIGIYAKNQVLRLSR